MVSDFKLIAFEEEVHIHSHILWSQNIYNNNFFQYFILQMVMALGKGSKAMAYHMKGEKQRHNWTNITDK